MRRMGRQMEGRGTGWGNGARATRMDREGEAGISWRKRGGKGGGGGAGRGRCTGFYPSAYDMGEEHDDEAGRLAREGRELVTGERERRPHRGRAR